MESVWTQLLESVAAAGPVALVLGYALLKVWDAYQRQIQINLDLQQKVLNVLKHAVENEDSHEE